MLSKKIYKGDGNTRRFLSDFKINTYEFAKPYLYYLDTSLPADGTGDHLEYPDRPWSFPDNLWVRGEDIPKSEDVVGYTYWEVLDNSISFYEAPFHNVTIWIEVATTLEEFGETLSQPSVEYAKYKALQAEAEALTADSYANAPENEQVKEYYANKDGTFGFNTVPKNSAFHWSRKAGGEAVITQGTLHVNSIDDLQLVDGNVYNSVNVKGYYSPNDGGGGVFNYDEDKVSINNTGTIINGWVRQFNGPVDALWFGARSGDNVDCIVELQKAIDTHDSVEINTPLNISKGLVIRTNTSLSGIGKLSALPIFEDGGQDVGHSLITAENAEDFSISGLSLDTSKIEVFTSGSRVINIIGSNNFSVTNCYLLSSGGGTACLSSNDYVIEGNTVEFSSTDGVTHNDATIDQWNGSHNFKILNNTILGGNTQENGILVTGEGSGGATPCYSFIIQGNKVSDTLNCGIQTNGREGVNSNFIIDSNIVDNVSNYHGIIVADCISGTVANNSINNVGGSGVYLTSQTEEGGVTGVKDVSITGNSISNFNMSNTDKDAGVLINNENSTRVTVTSNNIKGAYNTSPGVAIKYGVTECKVDSNVTYNVSVPLSNTSGNTLNYSDPLPRAYETTDISNVTSSSSQIMYSVSSEIVSCAVSLSITPENSGECEILVDLPIPSNIAGATYVIGSGTDGGSVLFNVSGDTDNNKAIVKVTAPTTDTMYLVGTFMYIIA